MEQLFGILLSLQQGSARHEDWVIGCLEGAWPRLVGDRLASVCRPVALNHSELKIDVLDDGWMGALGSIRVELQNKLREATRGTVKTIVFRKNG
jgi:hypothetical protein